MSYAASLVLLFTNDLFSWDKEYRAYIESKGSVHLTNSVHVVMSSHNVDQNAAKEIVRAEIREQEERFSQLSDQYKANSRPSESVLKWLDLLETTMAGNSIWSIRCPRYSKIERNPYLGHLRTFRSNTVRVIRSTADVFDSGTTIKTGNLINSDHGNTS
jgi:predicted MPP superfamily phosphohydrolase